MNDELQKRLLGYLSKVENGINDIVEFGSDQVPILVQEILAFSMIEAALYAAFKIIAAILILYGGNRLSKYILERSKDGEHYIPLALSILLHAPFLFSAIGNILIALKVYFAPRLFMLEYIREIVK